MATQIRFGYRCVTCGTTGDTFLPDDSRDAKAVACTDCGGSVTLARNDGSPDAFQSNCRPGPEIDVRGRDGRSNDARFLPFFDDLMSASFWWDSTGVEPQQAAMLLWYINPLDDPEGTPADSEDNRAYRAMLHEFTAVQKAQPGARRLEQWIEIAQHKRLRYNSWIDQWLRARSASDAAARVVHWTVHARQIANVLYERDTAIGVRDSLIGYSRRVMDEMRMLGIKGQRGEVIENSKTVQREALQGTKWWQQKAKN
ncbi:DNA-directed RNA polymerase subunit RPC12/RpoP [Paraburkholderia sp. RAU6.4a]|uniref:hypothetical protein n=1 Tax=Paraburkholderia sp. RAU6.4a TaxID=2991067 RepID=UPI003D1C84E6